MWHWLLFSFRILPQSAVFLGERWCLLCTFRAFCSSQACLINNDEASATETFVAASCSYLWTMWAANHCLRASTILLSKRRHQVTEKPGTGCYTLCLPPHYHLRAKIYQPTGTGIYFITKIIKKHSSLLLLVYCSLELFPFACFLHEASKKYCKDFTKIINFIIT